MKSCMQFCVFIFTFTSVLFFAGCSNTVKEIPIKLPDAKENSIALEKIGKLYVVNYRKDYKFKDFLKEGADSDTAMLIFLQKKGLTPYPDLLKLKQRIFSPFCSCFAAVNSKEEYILGRNLDYISTDTTLLLYTNPKDAYASVSLIDGTLFGINNANLEEKQLGSLPYFPFDGMNECGLSIASNSVESFTTINPEKISMGCNTAMRLLLDYAKDIDEAISLLQKYNIYFHVEPVNYIISDATGRSVIVGFAGDNIEITENNEPWLVLTNFRVPSFPSPEEATKACIRYKRVYNFLKNNKGKVSTPMSLLRKVVQSGNWSAIYNISSGSVQVVVSKNYHEVYSFSLLRTLTQYSR